MSQKIKFKRSAVQGKAPQIGDLELGELAINTFDGKIYIKQDNGTEAIVQVGDVSNFYTKSEIQGVVSGLSQSLDNLTDVTLTTPSTNQILKFDGSSWINADAPQSSNTLTSLPYDIAFFVPINPYMQSTMIGGYLSPRAMTLDPSSAHIAKCLTAGTLITSVFLLKQNGSTIATLTYQANYYAATISFSNPTAVLNILVGDSITLHTTTQTDNVIAGIGITLIAESALA